MGINHTPGPWIVHGAPGNVWAPFDQKNLANAYIADRDRETQAANARLIAESPAMLEILRGIERDEDGDAMLDAAGGDRIAAPPSPIPGPLRWPRPDEGARHPALPVTPPPQVYPPPAFVLPADITDGLASILIVRDDNTAWEVAARARWLVDGAQVNLPSSAH